MKKSYRITLDKPYLALTMSTPTLFISSVTGTQGQAVAQQAVSLGWNVRGITRNLESPVARSLLSIGVHLVQGDWDDESVLKQQISGCNFLFLALVPNFHDPGRELIQARRIFSIAKAGGVSHAIYSSSLVVNNPQSLTHWDPQSLASTFILSKQSIENELRTTGFSAWTILRPGYFMANFLLPKVTMQHPGLTDANTWTTALRPETKLAMIDEDDIAKFILAAFQEPLRFNSKELHLASEFQTPDELLATLSAATGRDLRVSYFPEEEVEAQRKTNPFVAGQLLTRESAKFVDLDEVKAWGIPMGTFREFVQREKDSIDRTYPRLA